MNNEPSGLDSLPPELLKKKLTDKVLQEMIDNRDDETFIIALAQLKELTEVVIAKKDENKTPTAETLAVLNKGIKTRADEKRRLAEALLIYMLSKDIKNKKNYFHTPLDYYSRAQQEPFDEKFNMSDSAFGIDGYVEYANEYREPGERPELDEEQEYIYPTWMDFYEETDYSFVNTLDNNPNIENMIVIVRSDYDIRSRIEEAIAKSDSTLQKNNTAYF